MRRPRFGANCDYVSFFGDGWNADWQNGVVGSAPQFNGSGEAGWLWVNHEYISNSIPTATSAPSGQQATHAGLLAALGVLTNDVTADVWDQDSLNTYDFKPQAPARRLVDAHHQGLADRRVGR